jgi:hypothetical protein
VPHTSAGGYSTICAYSYKADADVEVTVTPASQQYYPIYDSTLNPPKTQWSQMQLKFRVLDGTLGSYQPSPGTITTTIATNAIIYFKSSFTALKTGYPLGTQIDAVYDSTPPIEVGQINVIQAPASSSGGTEKIVADPAGGGGTCLQLLQVADTYPGFDGSASHGTIGVVTSVSTSPNPLLDNPSLWTPIMGPGQECWFNWDWFFPPSFDLSDNLYTNANSPSLNQWKLVWEFIRRGDVKGHEIGLYFNSDASHLRLSLETLTHGSHTLIDVVPKERFLVGGAYNNRWVPVSLHYKTGTAIQGTYNGVPAMIPNNDGWIEIYIDNVLVFNRHDLPTYPNYPVGLTPEWWFNWDMDNYGNWMRDHENFHYVRNVVASNVRYSGGVPQIT